MTVYIEYVLIDNFIITYALLKATFLTLGKESAKVRLILTALLGGVIALVYPLISGVSILSTVVKVATGLLLMLTGARYNGAKDFFYCTAVFFGYTFLTGGAVIGVYEIFNIPFGSETFIALSFIPALTLLYLLTWLIKQLSKRKTVMQSVVLVEVSTCGCVVKTNGFVDTGNCLYDGDSPVILCGKTFAKRLIKGCKTLPKNSKVMVSTVSGTAQLAAIKIDEIKIYCEQKTHIHTNVVMCISHNLKSVGYDIILHPCLMGESYGFVSDKKLKKVS